MSMELPKSLSAILFYQAEPMTIKRLAGFLKRSEGEIRDGLLLLEDALHGTGIRLIRNGDQVTLGTMPEASALIETMTKEELSRDLSKASLETLAIILYKGPVTRSEIDYVRGVNSTFILRNLLIRGLIERVDNPADQRSFLYKPTFQLLEYMGVSRVEDLPKHSETIAALTQFISTKEEEEYRLEHAEGVPDDTASGTTPEEEADVEETDEAGENFDDEELEEHRKKDQLEV